jgi:two-component system chemotaxis sensor kinase CheA
MNLAGELVLGRNQLLQAIALKDLHTVDASGQRLDLITSELQEAIMMTRMQPIGNVFNKFPRVVRDLAQNLGKDVRLSIDGEGVELDKTILEAINDPLTHLVRNSVDHGLETPSERRKVGKDSEGHVVLKAYHEAGQVNIDISDDGRGIDHRKLSAAALAKNLITEEQAASMSDKEKVNLIFLPGFSTASEVSDVSGRGVGMDVVKTNLDRLGGVVEIDSAVGVGTTIKIKLPLTLAIIPSQLISVGGERYAIPQVNLEELFRIPAAQVKDRIEKVGDAEVVRLRGNLLPLLRLADVIGVDPMYRDPVTKERKKDRRENLADRRSNSSPMFEDKNENIEEPSELDEHNSAQSQSESERRRREDRRYHSAGAVNIVVVYTGALKYGLVVDELHDSEEIVVKPLGRHLKKCKGYAGATIMGDGRVALILDVAGLSQMAELTSLEGTDRVMEAAIEQRKKSQKDILSLLLFRNAEDEQFAVPLGLVERIEKIKRSDIEKVGGKNVLQYRGASLPLLAIEDVANVKSLAEKEDLLVIVFVIAGNDVGLLATPPLDAIEESLVIDDLTLKQPGIMGSTIVNDHTTLIVNIHGIVENLNPDWFEKARERSVANAEGATVLYAEDSNFFRNQVKDYLLEGGYKVLEAEDGAVAWEILQQNEGEVSLVITDIEMPHLDGFGFVKKMKDDDRFSHLPIIALTTMAGDEDIKRGKDLGINDYLIKLDKEKLMERIAYHLTQGV